jgi:hypothetical protein
MTDAPAGFDENAPYTREDGDERGMIVYGYKFRPVLRV